MIANILRENNHNVDFFDCNAEEKNIYETEKPYDYLIITSSPMDRWETPYLDLASLFDIINSFGKKEHFYL